MKTASPPQGVLSDSLGASVIRFGVYSVALMLFFLSLPKLVEFGDVTIFKEHGVIEWMQLKLLVIAAATFFLAAQAFVAQREMMVILGRCLHLRHHPRT